MNQFQSEILEVERAFAQRVKEQGLKVGFLAYAADEAVLSRNGKLIQGKAAIAAYFDQPPTSDEVQLAWVPDFVAVSALGDLAYTYGKYTLVVIDQTGQEKKSEGIFHTVWKRQPTGEWRYVWD